MRFKASLQAALVALCIAILPAAAQFNGSNLPPGGFPGGGGGTPGGTNGQIQYNNAGAFGGLTNAAVKSQIGAAASGANSDITGLSAVTTIGDNAAGDTQITNNGSSSGLIVSNNWNTYALVGGAGSFFFGTKSNIYGGTSTGTNDFYYRTRIHTTGTSPTTGQFCFSYKDPTTTGDPVKQVGLHINGDTAFGQVTDLYLLDPGTAIGYVPTLNSSQSNNNIKALTGLTTPLSVGQGGTGSAVGGGLLQGTLVVTAAGQTSLTNAATRVLVDCTAGNVILKTPADSTVAADSQDVWVITRIDQSANTLTVSTQNAFQFNNNDGTVSRVVPPGSPVTVVWADGAHTGWGITVPKQMSGYAFSSSYIFGATGTLPSNATNYLLPGAGAVQATEIKFRVPRAMTLTSVGVNATAAPGGALTDTFTVRKNGVDTALAVSLTAAATTNSATGSISFAAGDLLSVKIVSATGTATANPIITVEAY